MSQPARFTQFSAQMMFLVFNSVQIVQIVQKAHLDSDVNHQPVLLPVRPWLPGESVKFVCSCVSLCVSVFACVSVCVPACVCGVI